MSFMYFNVRDLLREESAISMAERNVSCWSAVMADHNLCATAATCFTEDESTVSRRSKRCNLKPFHGSMNSFESVDLQSQDFPSPALDASAHQHSTCVCITEDALVGRFATPQTTVQSFKRPSVTPTRQPSSFKASQPEPMNSLNIHSPADDSSFPGPSTRVPPSDANKGTTLGDLQKPQTTMHPTKHPCVALIRRYQHPASCSSEYKIAPPEPINSSGFLKPTGYASRREKIGHSRHSCFPSNQPEHVIIDMEGISN